MSHVHLPVCIVNIMTADVRIHEASFPVMSVERMVSLWLGHKPYRQITAVVKKESVELSVATLPSIVVPGTCAVVLGRSEYVVIVTLAGGILVDWGRARGSDSVLEGSIMTTQQFSGQYTFVWRVELYKRWRYPWPKKSCTTTSGSMVRSMRIYLRLLALLWQRHVIIHSFRYRHIFGVVKVADISEKNTKL